MSISRYPSRSTYYPPICAAVTLITSKLIGKGRGIRMRCMLKLEQKLFLISRRKRNQTRKRRQIRTQLLIRTVIAVVAKVKVTLTPAMKNLRTEKEPTTPFNELVAKVLQ